MTELRIALNFVVVVTALMSALMWVKSARAKVLADERTSGVGALMGGYLIIKGENGERIDVQDTFAEQSRWNSFAAYSAAICALAQAALSLMPTTP